MRRALRLDNTSQSSGPFTLDGIPIPSHALDRSLASFVLDTGPSERLGNGRGWPFTTPRLLYYRLQLSGGTGTRECVGLRLKR